jgi:hypothetical protein
MKVMVMVKVAMAAGDGESSNGCCGGGDGCGGVGDGAGGDSCSGDGGCVDGWRR